MARVQVNRSALARIALLPEVQAELRRRADNVADAARTRAAAHIGDSSYQRSFQVVTIPRGSRIVNDDPEAAGVEFGVRAHVLTARPGGWLWWPGLPHPVKEVNHPGHPAYHVLGNAADAAREG
jgi:hypothetical protein